jgi:tRNA nucleotidyltransferase (CCA-adding enzyme)
MIVHEVLKAIASTAPRGRFYLVGGCVRDHLLGLTPHDYDVEVTGIAGADLAEHLRKFGAVNVVGKSFGVIKLHFCNLEFDFAIPRREVKTGPLHTDFAVEEDPNIPIEESLARRDFTINAIAFDVLTGELVDPFYGESDLNNRVLKHTSHRFAEDPLRVLRGFQFAGRFDFVVHPATIRLAKSIVDEYQFISRERVCLEFQKWAQLSIRPSQGLRFLRESGWIKHFPELHALIGIHQNPVYHPEGDVWEHTLQVVDAVKARSEINTFAALTHDFGKPQTTYLNEKGNWTSPGHEEAGVAVALSFFNRIGLPQSVVRPVLALIKNHHAHFGFNPKRVSKVLRLADELGHADTCILQLMVLVEADYDGRRAPGSSLPCDIPEEVYDLAATAIEKGVFLEAPPILIRGRDLIALGVEPGVKIGELLKQIREHQLAGNINSFAEANKYVLKRI